MPFVGIYIGKTFVSNKTVYSAFFRRLISIRSKGGSSPPRPNKKGRLCNTIYHIKGTKIEGLVLIFGLLKSHETALHQSKSNQVVARIEYFLTYKGTKREGLVLIKRD